MTEWILLAVSLLLVVACGLFVAAEFSFVTVDRGQVERAVADEEVGAAGVQRALRQLSTQLSGAQVGITVTNLAVGFLAEPAIAALLRGHRPDGSTLEIVLKGGQMGRPDFFVRVRDGHTGTGGSAAA